MLDRIAQENPYLTPPPEEDAHLENGHQDVGEIKVTIIKAKAESIPKVFCSPVLAPPVPAVVHERTKKGLTHHVKYASVS